MSLSHRVHANGVVDQSQSSSLHSSAASQIPVVNYEALQCVVQSLRWLLQYLAESQGLVSRCVQDCDHVGTINITADQVTSRLLVLRPEPAGRPLQGFDLLLADTACRPADCVELQIIGRHNEGLCAL